MPDASHFTWVAQFLASLFAVSALIHFAAPRPLRDAYRRWDYPRGFPVVTGMLEIAAAVLLASPELRLWGVLLGALILFFATVTLLHHRQYLWAVPSMLMMLALPPAAISTAEPLYQVRYAAEPVTAVAVDGGTTLAAR